MYTRATRRRQRLGSFEGLGVSRTLGNQFGTAADTGRSAGKELSSLIKSLAPHAVDAYKCKEMGICGPTPPKPGASGGGGRDDSGGGSNLPIIIGVGAVVVALFLFMGRKKA